MPSTSLTSSLLSLLPSYTTSTIPPSLSHLSESLLAQSRQRAAHLKPDEEIARAHACCEIACSRLRVKLRLPATKGGGAPCKPAVYKKLVGYLEKALAEKDAQGTPQLTPGRKRGRDGAVINGALMGEVEVGTPSESNTKSKSPRGNTFLGKIKASAQKSVGDNSDGEAPSYVMPSIRRLCNTFRTPLLAPHVYTGVCVVLKLDSLWPADEEANPDSLKETVTGYLIGLYIMTLTRMQTAKMQRAVYMSLCAKCVEVLGYEKGTEGVSTSIRKINQRKYASGQDWFASVPEKVFDFDLEAAGEADGSDDEENAENSNDEEKEEQEKKEEDEDDVIMSGRRRSKVRQSADDHDPEGVLLPGLHTMMQDTLDYLSEERTREFEKWKKQFLLKLDKLDKPSKSPAVKAGKAVAVA